jgi:quercetin dioxygenase-like cupin family protein
MKRVSRVAAGVLLALGAYAGVANLLHRVVFPQDPPDPSTFPREGDRFGSTAEGLQTEVIAVEDGWVRLRMEMKPGAEGPPLHYHRTFAEEFAVESGTLYVESPEGVARVEPGEVHTIEAGVPHRPFNPGDRPVVAAGPAPVMPQSFAACLVQVYHFLDAAEGEIGPALVLRVAAMDPICDSTVAEVPAVAHTLLEWLAVPPARLLGYRNYYPELSLHPPGAAGQHEALARPSTPRSPAG